MIVKDWTGWFRVDDRILMDGKINLKHFWIGDLVSFVNQNWDLMQKIKTRTCNGVVCHNMYILNMSIFPARARALVG